jgi:phosphoribosyl-ATP pyrophosphohydrolase/phosphoribosyl-AMP cyclohydrolase
MNRVVGEIARLDWSKGQGLVPAVVQHAVDGRVLMVGYMNREALERTLASQKVCFYSRSRRRLWVKGETSGHTLRLRSLHVDCDADAVLVLALPEGPTCHRGSESCFGDGAEPTFSFLGRLDVLIAARARERPAGSYTASLFEAGLQRLAQKVGEESLETALAAVTESNERLRNEAADLLFHVTVLLRARGMDLAGIVETLAQRHARR